MKLNHLTMRLVLPIVYLAFLTMAHAAPTTSQARQTRPSTEPGAIKDPQLRAVAEDPALPRVLLIGDSISMGYNTPVRELLKGKANVQRPGENCGPTLAGLKGLDAWLATGSPADEPPGKWDVIHFNWGLHDLKIVKQTEQEPVRQVPPEEYEKNLRELVRRLKETHAKLIWATTTPVPEGKLSPPRLSADVLKYNEIAQRVMKENDIPTDDLYSLVLPNLSELQIKNNVHFTPNGYHVLAEQVAATIEKALPVRGIPITQFGAVGDGRTLNTKSIQAAIDKLSATGGGSLRIPQGVFLSGAIFLKPGVELRLDKGAVLKGSTDVLDYPKANTRIEGHSEPFLPALVNAERVDHIRITGEGTLDGSGPPYWASFWKRRKQDPHCTNLEVERPRLIFIQDCQDVLISGITLKDSGFWNLHLYRCRDAVLEHLDIHVDVAAGQRAPSTDGMDLDSSQRVTVRDCTFSVHDDCIALKGTKGPFALDDKDSPPVEHVRITGCTFKAGGAALTCGSEATEVHDVVMEHCTVTGPMPLLHLKLRPDTPQHYHDIHISDAALRDGSVFDVSPWSQFFDLRGQPAPQSAVSDVTLSGITGSFESLGRIAGNKDTTISNITLSDFDVQLKSDKFEHQEIDGLKIQNSKVNGAAYP